MPHVREFHRRNVPQSLYFYATNVSGLAITLTSPTGRISKDNGAFANCTALPVSIGEGWYRQDLTATEADADNLLYWCNTLTANYAPDPIVSKSILEQSRVNIIGSNIGSGSITITNSATGHRTVDIIGSGELIRLRTTPHALSDTISFTSTLCNNFIVMDTAGNAGIQIKNGFCGIDLYANTCGVRMLQNNREIMIDHRHLTNPAITVTCPTGARYNMIQILNPSTGYYHAVHIGCPSTGGGVGLNLFTAHSGGYGLQIENLHPTGFGFIVSGILPEPSMPFDKDSLTFLDALSFIVAMMANKRVLNKDTTTDTLYRRDGITNMFSRSVSDDGSSQTVSATD